MRAIFATLAGGAALVALAHCGGDDAVALGDDDGSEAGANDAQGDATQPTADAAVDASTRDATTGDATNTPDASIDAAMDARSDSAVDSGPSCVDPAHDCPAPTSVCETAICTAAGVCGTANIVLGTACQSNNGGVVCNGNGMCVASHCMDGVQDADETGRDCGGATCAPCGLGGGCSVNHDCTTGYCNGTTCALAPNGTTCTTGTTCATGECVATGNNGAHICCATACADDGAASCGTNGLCAPSGGTCALYTAGTRCEGATCMGTGEVVSARTCNGAGTCSPGATSTCAPYVCANGACARACGTSDSSCAPGDYCDGVGAGTCRAKLAQGAACTGAGDSCVTGNCVNGFCCNSACGALCMACSAALTGGTNGTCANSSPGAVSGACASCAGNGTCTAACGDGIVETGEQCDLGANNGVMGSACSSTCQLTGDFIPETEPNDTQATANPLGTHAGFIAAIVPAGDLDYFSFQVPGPSSSVTIQVSDGVGGCPAGFDSVLRLYDPAGVQIAMDDNSGVSPCSLISPATQPAAAGLAAGTYRTRVELNGDNGTIPQYVVTITVQ